MSRVWVDRRLTRLHISMEKGHGIFATEPIPKGTTLILENPVHFLDFSMTIYSDIFQLLYRILTDDKNLMDKLKFLYLLSPSMTSLENSSGLSSSLMKNNENRKSVTTAKKPGGKSGISDDKHVSSVSSLFSTFSEAVLRELNRLKKIDKKIYKYFMETYEPKEIVLFALKYITNAFSDPEDDVDENNDMESSSHPVMLYIGAMLNHSCFPNVIFGKTTFEGIRHNFNSTDDLLPFHLSSMNFHLDSIRIDDHSSSSSSSSMTVKDFSNIVDKHSGPLYEFVAVRDIEKGEELCDNYVDITLSHRERQKQLKYRYGFVCSCQRCDKVNLKRSKMDKTNDDNDNLMETAAIQIELERLRRFGYSKSKRVSSIELKRKMRLNQEQ